MKPGTLLGSLARAVRSFSNTVKPPINPIIPPQPHDPDPEYSPEDIAAEKEAASKAYAAQEARQKAEKRSQPSTSPESPKATQPGDHTQGTHRS